jgi:hypothetical protein
MCFPSAKPDSGSSLISIFQVSDHMPISNIFPV